MARTASSNVAERLAAVARSTFGGVLPIRLRAWDGSVSGPPTAPTVVIHSPQALRRLLFHRPELALAQAYVTGELDVEGDLLDGFRRVWARGAQARHVRPAGARCPGVGLPPWAGLTVPQTSPRTRSMRG